mgnify:CR=1 FL=1
MHASFRPVFRAFSCKKSVKYPDIRRFFAEFARKTESKICIPDFPSALLVAFSCKSRHFCPSCHQRRVVEFGEYLSTEVLEDVPHRQWVFSLPKRLRVYFMYDRKLLAKLSRCKHRSLSRHCLWHYMKRKNRRVR